ncbi:MAG: T9SS type A sorting domain-containing protein [Bacteroidota bacterium]
MLRYRLLLFFCLGCILTTKATHNRAGEITYSWVTGLTYKIKVTTYTNIGGPNLADRCEDTVYFGDGTRAVVLRTNGPTSASCGAGIGGGSPISTTIKFNEYETTHTYPGPGNYLITMTDPNRNANVINIPNSVNQTFYIESLLVIPPFGSGKNNSPVLTFPPIDDGCVSQCFYHNPGAYDIDGDSISYELTTCRGSGGTTCPGYSYPVTGGGIFSIDSLTGTLTWCMPQLQGEYNMAMLIKEWRLNNSGSYVLVGYVLRDLQVSVGSCNNNPPQIPVIATDTCILAGTTLTYNVQATDINNDQITLWAEGGPFAFASNPATFSSTTGTSSITGIFNWTTDSTHIRRLPYQVTVKVKDADPAISLVHFQTFNVKVLPAAPIFLTTYPYNDHILLKWNKPATYNHTGANAFLKYNVYRKTGLSNWMHSGCETIPPAATGFVFIGSTTSVVTDTVFYDYNSGNPLAVGQSYSYVVLAQYIDGATSYVSNISSNQLYVGIEELELNNSVSVFPNPVTENLTISFNQNTTELFTVELCDVTGRNLKTVITKESTIQFKTQDMKPGIYFLKISGDKRTSLIKKIIKQ